MKISLRKANAVQLLINEKLSEPVSGNVTITKYDAVKPTVKEATQKLFKDIETKRQLIYVLYSLRKKVANVSMTVGIADLLTDLARNEKEASFAKQLQVLPVNKFDNDKVTEILADIITQKDAYGRSKDAVTVGLFDEPSNEALKDVVTTLRKEKTQISDKLLHLNVSTEIELDEKEYTVLKEYAIL
jgi:hypothetical protein